MQNLDNNTIKLNDGRITTIRNGIVTYDNRCIYSQIEAKTITNILVEASFFNDTNRIGSRTIPAGNPATIWLLGFDVHFELDRLGTPDEFPSH